MGVAHAVAPEELASCVWEATGGHGVDAAIELTGSPDAFEAIYPLVRLGGTLVLVGATYPARPVLLALEQVVRRCLTLRGLHNYAPRHLQAAIEFLDSHPELPFPRMVEPWKPLERVAEAVAHGISHDALRLGVRPTLIADAGESDLAKRRDEAKTMYHVPSIEVAANHETGRKSPMTRGER